MTHINLEAVDTDGAIREAADAVAGDTRLGFLRKAGIAGGAAVGGGAILGGLLTPALASAKGNPPSSFGAGDIGILNYALTLEYLEAAFYDEAQKKGKIQDKQLKAFLKQTKHDEDTHVKTLKAALGSKAAKKPKFDFKGTTGDEKTFAATSYVLENTGVHAYIGQAFNIKSPAYLGVALSIVTIEGRHAGAVGSYLGMKITPNGPFDSGWTASKVLSAVKGTGFIVG